MTAYASRTASQPLAGIADAVADFGELVQMAGDLAFVPGAQDRVHSGDEQRATRVAEFAADFGGAHGLPQPFRR